MYGSDWDEEERYGRVATEAEAHAEWHRNAGVPMGTPGCPWDACHAEPDDDEGADDDPRWDPVAAADEAWADALAAQWDDDPNPYHGDYSEM